MNRLQRRLIKLAQELESPCSHRKKSNHITFICDGPRILSIGFNHQYKTSPLATGNWNNCLHSEIDAYMKIRHYDLDIKHLTMYNVRLMRNGKSDLAMPCSHCHKFLGDNGFRHMFYSTISGFEYMRI